MDQYDKYNGGELLKNRYSKITDISEGSYGLVTLAKDTKLNNRLVAVKYIYPLDYKKKGGRASSSPAQFRHKSHDNTHQILKLLYEEAAKEISVQQVLGIHPNIAALYDHFDSYLVLEYCSRGDLYDAIQNGHGPSTPKDIKDVFTQIINALDFCHSHSIYHRDLKPENILIAEDWSIKLCDWGLATNTRKVTNKSEFDIGSERYMAPELFDTELEFYDASKIDLWSMGIVLLTLVFHKNPFEIANYSDKRFVQFSNNRESLFDIFSTMTGDLFAVLRYCLNIDPQNRDLTNVRAELSVLNYFTIDDEFESSDFDYSDEKEDEIEEIDDEGESTFYMEEVSGGTLEYSINTLNGSTLNNHPLNGTDHDHIHSTWNDTILNDIEEQPVTHASKESSVEQTSTDSRKSGSPKSAKSESPLPRLDTKTHEASDHDINSHYSSTLEPIPIDNRSKFFRNTRKPINVASYSSYQKSYKPQKYVREDFFTPKSVFNHYMKKYAENKEESQRTGNKTTTSSNWKKKNNNNKRKKKKTEFSNFNTPRRKSNSFSSTKPRSIVVNSVNSGNGNHLGSSSYTGNSYASSSGKYVPPFMRSPNYTKSPLAQPDYAEVFELEDDFQLDNKEKKIPSFNLPSGRPMSMTNDISTMLSSDTNGKYIPPFRRGSHLKEKRKDISLEQSFQNLSLKYGSVDW